MLILSFQVHKYIDYILTHQTATGWLGPDDIPTSQAYWSKYPVLMALRQVGRCMVPA